MKAIDLFKDPDALQKMEQGIRNYRYEAALLELCKERAMDGIVRALATGIHLEDIGFMQIPVPYIIFEHAEGDLRTHEDARSFNLGWRLRIFHGVCVAMRQLHSAGIAHQDLKPSNILVFDNAKAKIADLGRATRREDPSYFEWTDHVGDKNYMPPELLYKADLRHHWLQRRLGADFFTMGCVLCFLMTDASLLTLLFERLHRRFWWKYWAGSYEQVIPHLEAALQQVLSEIDQSLPDELRREICSFLCAFATPDPAKRGRRHAWTEQSTKWDIETALANIIGQYDLTYAISRFDHLASRMATSISSQASGMNQQRFLEFALTR